MKPVIVIPAYEPDEKLVDLLHVLCSDIEQKIIVVNDGSKEQKALHVFRLIRDLPQVDLLHHATNLGKGQALKTAFNHFLLTYADSSPGVITADADGQHTVRDILHVSMNLTAEPQTMWLGSRTFKGDIPFRSRFGNRMTKCVFRFVTGISLTDTQTGLRGIPVSYLAELLTSSAQGYEFELEMLVNAIRVGIQIREIQIETVYIDGNKSSHFNPIFDSLKIYFVFIRFSALALMTAAIDYIVFTAILFSNSNVLLSFIGARFFACTFNFLMGKHFVFKSADAMWPELIRYVIIVLIFMGISYGMVLAITSVLPISPIIAKALSEGLLFFASFAVQNLYVYGKKQPTSLWR